MIVQEQRRISACMILQKVHQRSFVIHVHENVFIQMPY
jgi:hypothetical protein